MRVDTYLYIIIFVYALQRDRLRSVFILKGRVMKYLEREKELFVEDVKKSLKWKCEVLASAIEEDDWEIIKPITDEIVSLTDDLLATKYKCGLTSASLVFWPLNRDSAELATDPRINKYVKGDKI
jgi:hypothetical protein